MQGYYNYEVIHQMLYLYKDWQTVLVHYNNRFYQNIGLRSFRQSYNRWITKNRYQTNNYRAKDFDGFNEDRIYIAEVVI